MAKSSSKTWMPTVAGILLILDGALALFALLLSRCYN